jgi:hypothetical protein
MANGGNSERNPRKPAMRQTAPPPDVVSPRKRRRQKTAAARPGGKGPADAVDGPVIDRPPRVLLDIDLKKETVRLYWRGWSYADIAAKLDRPRGTIRGWIDDALREYVATAEVAADLKRRQLLQISKVMRTVFEVMEAGGKGKLALEAIDRLIKLQQQEADVAGFKGVQDGGEDPVDAGLQAILDQARAEVAERERRLAGEP